jgi:GNAT superfamily N-acetyltransferase
MNELLEEYDRQTRRELPFFDPAYKLEREGGVVRLVGERPAVMFSGEGASIDKELERFSGRSFQWKWHSHDKPAGLKDELLARGFTPVGASTVMTLEVPHWIHQPKLDLRPIEGGESLAPVFEVHGTVWPGYTWLYESLERERRAKPNDILFYAAYNMDRPVASCWMRCNGDFAGFFGGAVVPEARGHGYYRAMVAARLADAKARRLRWAVTQAGDMSRPVLEKLGWNKLTLSEPLASPVR